ncbi:MAG: rhodanese protein [uncultured bacterium]|nr:MAG: rhodanese protein [uncultured bacterium]
MNTKQILQFIQNHWALCAAFAAVAALLIFEEFKNKVGGIPKISAQQLIMLINRENAVTVDLRNQKAFATGHIIDSINIEYATFDAHIKKIEPHKNHSLVLIDDSDTNVASIGAKLQKQGFSKIYALSGGLQAWKSANLPLTKNQSNTKAKET